MGHNTKFIGEKRLWKRKNVKLVILLVEASNFALRESNKGVR